MYQNAFDVNALGSANKKQDCGVYFTLANFDPFYRSSIDNLQLMLLCNERDFKYFANDKLFSTMLSDLRDLETNGLEISGHAVKAAVFCITGDNLGSHNIGGFTENVSTSNYCCRYCLATRGKQFDFDEPAAARTFQIYEAVMVMRQNPEG